MVRFVLLLNLLLLPLASWACKCAENPPLVTTALRNSEVVFSGTVMRDVRELFVAGQTSMLVKVKTVFKGCNIQVNDFVTVVMADSPAGCGVVTEIGVDFVFSGSLETVGVDPVVTTNLRTGVDTLPVIASTVSVSSCLYNRPWKNVTASDKKALLRFASKNFCFVACPLGAECPGLPKPGCTKGDDCPKNHYCNGDTCVSFDATCPPRLKAPICRDDPCILAKPCAESVRCFRSICGGCSPVFVDAANTVVCLK